MPSEPEIVVTGMGVVSPIGIGRAAFWESLLTGRSGVKPVQELQGTPFPVLFGGEIDDFDGKLYVTPRKSLKLMCREIQTAFASAVLAKQDALLVGAPIDHDRFGVVFGSEVLYSSPGEMVELYHNCTIDGQFDISRWGQRMSSDLFPLWMLKYLPNMPACHIAIAHDARGPNNTFTLGEVSGLHAMQESARCLQRGHADVMIAGGTGSRLNISSLLFRGHAHLSRHAEDPTKACRPFDATRDGTVHGEGAAAIVLETATHAQARGVRPLAQVLGFGNAYEANPLPGEHRTGRAIRQSIAQALREGGVQPSEVTFVSAHGLGTVIDDQIEAQAIHAELGEVAVFAPKSYFGNMGGGTAAVEAVAAIEAVTQGVLPGTLNYEHPDPKCPVLVSNQPRRFEGRRVALILSQTFTGQAAAVLIASVENS